MEKWFGKIALVTGSSSGIGAAIAEILVKHGVNVIGSARNLEKLQQHSLKLQSEKGHLYPFQCDLQKEEQILSLFEFIKQKFGILHICVNNAGLGHSSKILNGKTEVIYNFCFYYLLEIFCDCIITNQIIVIL